ncbi:hypothetical protein PAESOLCIP111_05801 [Paenibacillus solanacearum]|uniref:VOC domain-containing protein n=1 Tax=Paenibacillus solanacearum TaxID=2048548 RepID=A0A916KA46_9BACL|nr:VOC family protein [Paenibacillus solanacearum]CAG7649102.1 hypothetical protein PAESOLCIP111_05801 [Paenibacillus solanacearum]
MRLNHLNLCVSNIIEARDFFRDIFDFRLVEQKGEAIAVMNDGHGFTLVLSGPRTNGDAVAAYPQDFHVGFYVDTREEVDRFCDRLVAADVAVDHRPREIRGGYTLYFTALGGIMFEVTSFA